MFHAYPYYPFSHLTSQSSITFSVPFSISHNALIPILSYLGFSILFATDSNLQFYLYNINVYKQAASSGFSQGASVTSFDRFLSFLKKKRAGSSEYLLEIIKQIQGIETQWQRMVLSLDDELTRARKMNITVDDDEAYLRCCQLLQEEFQAEEDKFAKMRRKLKIAIQTAEEHIDICQGEKGEREKQKNIIEEEIKELEVEIGKVNKRHRKIEQIRAEIEEEGRMIENSNVKLQDLKEKSYEQKTSYLQVQENQMALMQQLARVQEQEQIYYDFKGREEKYRQLTKILQKLHNRSSFSNRDVQTYLKDRISQMSVLRTNLLSIDEKLQEFDVLIQEQNYIIQGLKYKSQNFEEVDNGAFRKYKSKYEELYFNRNNNLENWKSYKHYLEELLKKNKIQHHLIDDSREDTGRYKIKSSYAKHSHLRTEPNVFQVIEQEPSLSPSFKNIRTPQMQKKMSQRLSGPSARQETRPVKLPKLVRMTGASQGRMKMDLKTNIKKMMNESDISLQSVDSNDENMSGEFIEVQFHKK